MKKSRIILCVFAVLIIAIAAVAFVQRDNIAALIDGMRYSDEDLDNQLASSEESVTEYMRDNDLGEIRLLTAEEEAALVSGEISQQDAVKIMTGSMTLTDAKNNKNNSESAQETQSGAQGGNGGTNSGEQGTANGGNAPSGTAPKPETPSTPAEPETPAVDYDTLISEKVAELYVVKANFSSQLASMKKAAENEFDSYPKEERTDAKKIEIIKSKISGASALEKQCDAKVADIVSELRSLLSEAGRDTSLADKINEAYNQEKKVMKAKYVNKYF